MSHHLSLRSALIIAVLVSGFIVPIAGPAQAQGAADTGYWHTAGTQILDAQNRPVRIAGLTWYGMDTTHWVPAGLDFQPYTRIMDIVKLLGYNLIRLPISNEMVERNPTVRDAVAASPQLRGKRALQVLDALVAYAGQIGLKIIIDDHRSRASRPMGINVLNEPLWYTSQYPESAWIRDWQTLARRYLGNDTVVGFDLRNEPHTGGSGPWNVNAYLHQGATWGPYRGVDRPASDWRLAAERAGNGVLAINPHLLIVVEGIQMYPDPSQPGGVTTSWWAGILTPAKRYPVVLNVPHQLVYSVHQYGPRKHDMPWFNPLTYSTLQKAWHDQWAFLLDQPASPSTAPLWIGEFGTCNDDPGCFTPRGRQGVWLGLVLRFLREHPQVGWSFFALNGTNANNCATDNGLVNAAWNNVASKGLAKQLATIQPSPPPPSVLQIPGPLFPGAVPHGLPRSPSSPLCQLP